MEAELNTARTEAERELQKYRSGMDSERRRSEAYELTMIQQDRVKSGLLKESKAKYEAQKEEFFGLAESHER